MTDIKDYGRLSDRIWVQYGNTIYDQKSFDVAYDNYMIERGDLTIAQDTSLREGVYQQTEAKITRISVKERALRQQKMMTSGIEKKRLRKGEHEYIGTGKVKGKIVYVYQSNITIRGKQVIRFRDKTGRYVKRID